MDFKSYQSFFHSILSTAIKTRPYDNADYFNYATLNYFRQQRWLSKGVLNDDLIRKLASLEGQRWIFITEPWCSDAAHTLPFIARLLAHNEKITLDIQRRDEAPFLIEDYLSGHRKSIPKLIVRNHHGQDLFVWGSRPEACQALYDKLLQGTLTREQREIELQKWYNADKGASFQLELLEQLLGLEGNKEPENYTRLQAGMGNYK